MANSYRIKDPNGKWHRVTGEGTKEEALAAFKKQWATKNRTYDTPPTEANLQGLRDTGRNTIEAVRDRPLETLDTLARSGTNFVTLGLADKFSAGMDKLTGRDDRPYADVVADTQKTSAERDARAGSWDDALNVGAALYNPYSAAAKYAPAEAATTAGKALNVGKRAAVNATEQAGLSGAQSVIHGDSPEDVLKSMAAGGTFGAGGSIGADATGSVMNVFRKKGGQPQYASEDALQKEAQAANLNTKKGQKAGDDAITRNALMDQVRLAETRGPGAFGQLSERLEGAGRDPKFPREVYEGISKLGTPNQSPIKRGIANIMDFGGGLGKLGAMKVSPLLPGGAAVLKTMADLGGKLDKKTLAKVKQDLLRGSVSGENPYMTPEMKEQLRGYLAKMATGGPRTSQ